MLATGCAVPQYAIRQTPVPDESAQVRQIETAVSDMQARSLNKQGAYLIRPGERLWGFDVYGMLQRIAAVTERPYLEYRAYLLNDDDPNAAALADGRTYVTKGLLSFLANRPNAEQELAFVLCHELAHTNAQHIVQRTYVLQKQQLLMAAVALGASRLGSGSESAANAARMLNTAAQIVQDVALNGYSQNHELEADQLGIQYMRRAGYDVQGALSLLDGFQQFDAGIPILRTHPYASTRREHLLQYLSETQPGSAQPGATAPVPIDEVTRCIGDASGMLRCTEVRQTQPQPTPVPGKQSEQQALEERIRSLRAVQKTYPSDSISWRNLDQQIRELEQQRSGR